MNSVAPERDDTGTRETVAAPADEAAIRDAHERLAVLCHGTAGNFVALALALNGGESC